MGPTNSDEDETSPSITSAEPSDKVYIFLICPLLTCLKIDDTVTGIQEGLNAQCWTIGVSRWSINMDIMNEEEEHKIDMLTHENDNYYQLVKKKQIARSILLTAKPHYVIDTLEGLDPLIDSMNDRGKSLPFQRAMKNNYNYRMV